MRKILLSIGVVMLFLTASYAKADHIDIESSADSIRVDSRELNNKLENYKFIKLEGVTFEDNTASLNSYPIGSNGGARDDILSYDNELKLIHDSNIKDTSYSTSNNAYNNSDIIFDFISVNYTVDGNIRTPQYFLVDKNDSAKITIEQP